MKVAVRITLMIVGFAVAGFVLWRAFDDFDLAAVGRSIGAMTWVDVARLLGAFVVLLVAEAFLGAAFIPGLTLRHGAMSWLASNAIASVVPGPSDVPLRYRMFRSWGLEPADAATASAGATLINVASKLVVPVLAGLAIWIGDVHVGGVRNLIVTACAVSAAVVLVVGFAFGSEQRTAVGARLLARLVRRPKVAVGIVRYRNSAATLLQRTWHRALIGIVLVTAFTVVLFVWSMRAVGVEGSNASWLALFSVWAIVRGLTVLPTMPGDAGVSELAFVSLLNQASDGVSVNTVTAGIVLYRAITWILPIPLGFASIALWRWDVRTGRRRPLAEAPAGQGPIGTPDV